MRKSAMNLTGFYKSFILLLITLSVFALPTVDGNQLSSESKVLVIKGATLYDGNGGKIENSTIIIRDGKIEAVENSRLDIPAGSQIVDASGKFITPGLIDAHIHFSQSGFFDARPGVVDLTEALPYLETLAYLKNHPEAFFEAYLRSGVTGVYDVGGPAWTIQLQRSAEKNPNAPHVAASGPLLTPAPESFVASVNAPVEKTMVSLSSASKGKEAVAYNSLLGSTGIKVWGIDSKDTDFMNRLEAVADETAKRGNKLIVHAIRLNEAKAALENGARLLVHSIGDQEVDEEFIRMAKELKTIYTPTLIVPEGYVNAMRALLGEPMDIVDPHKVVDSRTRKLFEDTTRYAKLINASQLREQVGSRDNSLKKLEGIHFANLRKLHEAGVPIAVGTDAGNPGTLHGISIYNELERMQQAGIPPEDLIVMATRNGAMAMERLDDFGTLEKGKIANLILLDEDPAKDISNFRTITHVMRSGLLRSVSQPFTH